MTAQMDYGGKIGININLALCIEKYSVVNESDQDWGAKT